MLRLFRFALACLVIILGTVSHLRAAVLFGVDDFSDELVMVDETTASLTLVGSLGGDYQVSQLAFDSTGTLYALDSPSLLTIDTSTGAVTTSVPISAGFNGVMSLAFDASDTLYALNSAREFYSVDAGTGQATFLLDTDRFLTTLAFSPDGTLYGVDLETNELITMDIITGTTTSVGLLDPLNVSAVRGLTFDTEGTLFGVDIIQDELVTIDPDTATKTVVGQFNSNFINSLAAQSSGVPEPSTVVLLGLSGLCVAASRWRQNRHSRIPA